MPPVTYNTFQDKQEEFWKTVNDRFSEDEQSGFRTFFIPLFIFPDTVTVASSSHPLNIYGAAAGLNDNIDRIRVKIMDECTSPAPPQNLLRYMFEEEDHPIYEAFHTMMRTYMELGNSMRDDLDTDSD
jgi:hypothetical protein